MYSKVNNSRQQTNNKMSKQNATDITGSNDLPKGEPVKTASEVKSTIPPTTTRFTGIRVNPQQLVLPSAATFSDLTAYGGSMGQSISQAVNSRHGREVKKVSVIKSIYEMRVLTDAKRVNDNIRRADENKNYAYWLARYPHLDLRQIKDGEMLNGCSLPPVAEYNGLLPQGANLLSELVLQQSNHGMDPDDLMKTFGYMPDEGKDLFHIVYPVGTAPEATSEKSASDPYPRISFPTRTVLPWRAVFSALGLNHNVATIAKAFLENAIAFSKFYTLTNGGLTGFLHRVNESNEMAARLASQFDQKVLAENLTNGLADDLPTYDDEEKEMTMAMTDVFPTFGGTPEAPEITWGGIQYYKVQSMSDSGPSWYAIDGTKVNRVDVLMSDLYSTLNTIVDIQNLSEVRTVNAWGETLRKTGIHIAKPKYEVMKSSKVLTKIRPIKVGNSCNQVMLGIACQLFTKRMVTVRNSSIEASKGNLYAWTPFFGGMSSIIEGLMSLPTDDEHSRFAKLYYSDNIYLYDKKTQTFVSADVAKMEASSTASEAGACMRYMLSCIEKPGQTLYEMPDTTPEEVETKVIVKNIYSMIIASGSHLCHDVEMIRDNLVMTGRGLSSGSQNTFLVNHMRMAVYSNWILKYFEGHHEEFEAMVATCSSGESDFPQPSVLGVPLEISVTSITNIPNNAAPASDALLVPPAAPGSTRPFKVVGLHNMDEAIVATFQTYGSIIRMDMLGYDALVFDDPDNREKYILGILSWDRVWKTLLFRKTDGVYEKKKSDPSQVLQKNLINYVTLLMLNWIGGFAYADTHALIRSTGLLIAINIVDALNNHPEGTDEILDEAISSGVNDFKTLVQVEDSELPRDDVEGTSNVMESLRSVLAKFRDVKLDDEEFLASTVSDFSIESAIRTLHVPPQPADDDAKPLATRRGREAVEE